MSDTLTGWYQLASFLVASRWTGAGVALGAVGIVIMLRQETLFASRLLMFFWLAKYHDITSGTLACTFLVLQESNHSAAT